MRLTPDVALVGGGTITGFGLSADFDAHVYLLDGGGGELALVDCGMGTELGRERVLGRIRDAGCDPADVQRLLLTHYHTDHAGGAAAYREELELRVSIGADVQAALEGPDHEATQFGPAQRAGIFPADYAYRGCPVDEPLRDGDELAVGRLQVRYLATPGHCAGHGSYLVRGGERTYLLAGDAVFHGGKLFLQGIPDCDLQASLASVRRLSELEFDALLPGHGAIALQDGGAHVAAAMNAINALGVPPNIV
jgi:glyoxylase-like metal-dependent hydrolase (beta-lactamase superfamily II)